MEEAQQQPSLDSKINKLEEEDEEETQLQHQKSKRREQELNVLHFLDSTDDYLNLIDALSATLRQGWLELASARHSMGASRVNTALLDLKNHSAATSLQVTECDDDGSEGRQPYIKLRKWMSADCGKSLGEEKHKEKLERKSDSPQLRQRNISEFSEDTVEKSSTKSEESFIIDDQVQKERLRTISTFGTLVSPKLRSAQISFENALEAVVEIANKRVAMLSSLDPVKKGLENTKA